MTDIEQRVTARIMADEQAAYDRTYRLDRWMEATYGARLHLTAIAWKVGTERTGPDYYPRWQELYHAGLKGDIAPARLS
jgi:hypothetical protein